MVKYRYKWEKTGIDRNPGDEENNVGDEKSDRSKPRGQDIRNDHGIASPFERFSLKAFDNSSTPA